MIFTIRVVWDLPIDRLVYEELGRVLYKIVRLGSPIVKWADAEGIVLVMDMNYHEANTLRELGKRLKRVNVYVYEGEEE